MAFAPKRVPVFRVRKTRGGPGPHRTIHTTQEHKMNQYIDEQEPQARPTRQSRLLPHSWWDFCRTFQRSWKKHRRVQHK